MVTNCIACLRLAGVACGLVAIIRIAAGERLLSESGCFCTPLDLKARTMRAWQLRLKNPCGCDVAGEKLAVDP